MLGMAPLSGVDGPDDGELQEFMSASGNVLAGAAMLGTTLPCDPQSDVEGAEHEEWK